ncbi:hypothetical protein SAMN05421676_11333 [Salinibacillus kushneri]|uniref:Uncharacterized protein n=1 Tax=Salinibacillus kushneri TaxID=237682 RepID=A0A1I0INA2_9BACI|nr:hypothetical protein [Salinibacillus kushneri]SET98518.1 hypothetical protein SAMN05421676_11333 [Salinibacillus kushneri]
MKMLPSIIRLGLLVLSWLSFILYPKKSLQNYFPVSLFTSGLVLLFCSVSFRYKFWMVSGNIVKRFFNDLSFVFGPFFAGTLWIFHFTFGNFRRYVVVNSILNIVLSFLLNPLFQRYNLYKFVNFKAVYLFLTYIGYALLLYSYQLLISKQKKEA